MRKATARDSLTIRRLDQVKALAHPLRYRIFERLVITPGSPKAVALDMGLKETRLYHHFRILEEAGLIKRTRSQRKRGTVERIYAASADRIVIDRARFGGDLHPGSSLAMQSMRAASESIAAQETWARAQKRDADVQVARLVLRLTPARAKRLETLFDEFLTEAQREESGADLAEYHFIAAFHPAAPRPSERTDDEQTKMDE